MTDKKYISEDPYVEQEMQKHPYRNVSIIGLLNKDKEILLVRTSKLPNYWQPIGGGMEPFDESPLDTIKREVREEVNLILESDQIEELLRTSYDFGKGYIFFFVASYFEMNKITFNKNEILEHKWISINEALNLEHLPATGFFLEFLKNKYSKNK